MLDLIYDNVYPHKQTIREEKSRIYKRVDRKGNFLWWEWTVDDTMTLCLGGENHDDGSDFTSGFCDFTPNGDVLELTQEQRDRALVKKVKL